MEDNKNKRHSRPIKTPQEREEARKKLASRRAEIAKKREERKQRISNLREGGHSNLRSKAIKGDDTEHLKRKSNFKANAPASGDMFTQGINEDSPNKQSDQPKDSNQSSAKPFTFPDLSISKDSIKSSSTKINPLLNKIKPSSGVETSNVDNQKSEGADKLLDKVENPFQKAANSFKDIKAEDNRFLKDSINSNKGTDNSIQSNLKSLEALKNKAKIFSSNTKESSPISGEIVGSSKDTVDSKIKNVEPQSQYNPTKQPLGNIFDKAKEAPSSVFDNSDTDSDKDNFSFAKSKSKSTNSSDIKKSKSVSGSTGINEDGQYQFHNEHFIKDVYEMCLGEIAEIKALNQHADNEEDKLDEAALNRALSSRFLKLSVAFVIDKFSINMTKETMFADIAEPPSKLISASYVSSISKNLGLQMDLNRVSLEDVVTEGSIILCEKSVSYVYVGSNKIYDPSTNSIIDFHPQDISAQYSGYSIVLYNNDYDISKFVEKTGFLGSSIKANVPMFLEILILSFLINVFAIASPFFTINVYDRVVPNNSMSTLLVLSSGMMLIYLFDFIFKSTRMYITDYVSTNVGQTLDVTLLERLIKSKAPGIAMTDGAKINTFKEMQGIREFYFSRFIPSIIDIPFSFMLLGVLAIISPILALVPLVFLVVIFISNIFFQVPLQNSYSVFMKGEQNKNAFLTETVHAGDHLKLFNGVGKRLSTWLKVLERSNISARKHNNIMQIASNLSLFLMNLSTVVVIIVGVKESIAGMITVGGLIASSTLSSRIIQPVVAFSGLIVRYRSIQQTLVNVQRIINKKIEGTDENVLVHAKAPFDGGISIENVDFFYPGQKSKILSSINLDIKPKEKVGIIGRTGAGKSTITKLIMLLDIPNTGYVKIDGIDINKIHTNELRATIGYVPQRSFFFGGTVRDNIIMSNTHISKERYDEACELAGVNEILKQTGNGDDMLIHEGGSNLSGGQQQIVALARAIVTNPSILIMDEPTNGMDVNLEARFMHNVTNYAKNKTLILITHRSSQLKMVDRVVLLEKGRVALDGERDSVLQKLSNVKQ